MANLPHFPQFDVHTEPSSVGSRWKRWIKRFTNFLVALDIKEDTQKRALLLHYAGSDVYDIFDTLPGTGDADDYDTAIASL